MEKKFSTETDEIVIDFNKIFKIFLYRKNLVIICYVIMIIFSIAMTFIMPKKYISETKLLIDKTNSTNLAAINPFLVASADMTSQSFSNLLKGGGGTLVNEIEIIKSPLVLNNVIKENDLKYAKGPQEGEYINPRKLSESSSFKVENLPETNVITISYKAEDPEKARQVVVSTVKSYIDVTTTLNSKKAFSDKTFIETKFAEAQKKLDEKIKKLQSETSFTTIPLENPGLVSLYNRKLSQDLNVISKTNIDYEKLKNEAMLELEYIKVLKEKFEWINMLEKMAQNVTNVTVLQEPELKRPEEYSEPSLLINIILGLVASGFLTVISLFLAEIYSKKLTYSDFDENTVYINLKTPDLLQINTKLHMQKVDKFIVVPLIDNNKLTSLKQNQDFAFLDKKGEVILPDNVKTEQNLDKISQAKYVIFLTEPGSVYKDLYKTILGVLKSINKNNYYTVVVEK